MELILVLIIERLLLVRPKPFAKASLDSIHHSIELVDGQRDSDTGYRDCEADPENIGRYIRKRHLLLSIAVRGMRKLLDAEWLQISVCL